MELIFIIKPQFQLLFLPHHLHTPKTPTLCDPSAFAFLPLERVLVRCSQGSTSSFLPSMWYLLWLIWVSSCGRSAMRAASITVPLITALLEILLTVLTLIELSLLLNWRWHLYRFGCFLLLGVTRKAPDSGFHPLFESTEVVLEADLTHIHPGPPGSLGLPSTWFVSAFWASTHFLTCAQNPTRRTLFLQLEVGSLFKWDSIGEKENVKLKASPL